MIVYHIDRTGSLREGMELSLSPDGLSRHGQHYWSSVQADQLDDVNDFIIEHIFEEIRLRHYPDKPSRFASSFACADMSHLRLWESQPGFNQDYSVWQVETPAFFLADSALLRCLVNMSGHQVFDFSLARAFAHEYWQGATVAHPTDGLPDNYRRLLDTLHPLPEALLPPTARIIRRL